jgi:hypothetical protein
LNDRTVGATTTLETPDGSVILYDFGNNCPGNIQPANWPITTVPTTNNANEWTNESTQGAYQSFWVTSQVVPIYEGIGIDFGTVRACLDFTEDIKKRESVRILVSTKSQVYAQEV